MTHNSYNVIQTSVSFSLHKILYTLRYTRKNKLNERKQEGVVGIRESEEW